MTIRTKEAEVPDEFPPARLFLDDIDEIVRILVEAIENWKEQRKPSDQDAETTVTFTIKDQVCDGAQELPKIAERTVNLLVKVGRQDRLPETVLRIRRLRTSLLLIGFTKEEELRIFYKLTPIFKRRNRWLATLVHSHLLLFGMLSGGSFVGAMSSLSLVLNKPTPTTPVIVIGLLSAAILTTIFANVSHHSIIIMRHSSEPSGLRQELLHKVPVAAISSILTFLLTLLGLYLKHKYWP